MAHKEQQNYCSSIKVKFPKYFKNIKVLDCGSQDINGNNRFLFENCNYTGIDVNLGKNVDISCSTHIFDAKDNTYDTIISTECFEHDMYYVDSLKNIIRMLKPGGLFLFTCATTNRAEHGTLRTTPSDSPLTCKIEDWMNYYKNLTEKDIKKDINIDDLFSNYEFVSARGDRDLYFYGIKK